MGIASNILKMKKHLHFFTVPSHFFLYIFSEFSCTCTKTSFVLVRCLERLFIDYCERSCVCEDYIINASWLFLSNSPNRLRCCKHLSRKSFCVAPTHTILLRHCQASIAYFSLIIIYIVMECVLMSLYF